MNNTFDHENTYKKALDELRFSEEAKEKMLENLSKSNAHTPRWHARRAAVLTVAAMLALCLGVGVGAATGALKTAAQAFAGVFGGGAAETELLDRMGKPVDAAASAGGITLTADAIIGDQYNYGVVYSLTKDDGTAFALTPNELGYLPLYFEAQTTDVGTRGSRSGGSYFFDADPADSAIQYVELMSVDEKPHGTATADFQNLMYSDGADSRMLAEGSWSLKFEIDYPDSGVSLSAGQSFPLNGMTATLNAVTISPLGLRIDYTVDAESHLADEESGRESEAMTAEIDKFTKFPIVLHKADGTTLELQDRLGSGMRPQNGKTICNRGGVFDTLLPLEDITSLTIGDVELPLP